MSELFAQLGLSPKLLVAQGINFLIVLVVLTIFVYRPLLKFLSERRQKIAQGLADAEEAKRAKEWAEADGAKIVAEAKQAGVKLLSLVEEEAHTRGQALVVEAEAQARTEAEAIKLAAQKEIKRQQAAAEGEVKKQAAELAVKGVEKLFRTSFDAAKNEKLIKELIAES